MKVINQLPNGMYALPEQWIRNEVRSFAPEIAAVTRREDAAELESLLPAHSDHGVRRGMQIAIEYLRRRAAVMDELMEGGDDAA